ncbi:MAG: DUF2085 domain-containing protein [Lachnospiraceae bacterium]
MSGLRQTILELIRSIGNHSGCHQMAERSFFYKGKQFPVCARCTGVTVGQAAALIIGFFSRVPASLAAVMLMAMGIDWSIQELGIKESTNRRRFITGVLGGFGLFTSYINIARVIKKIKRRSQNG